MARAVKTERVSSGVILPDGETGSSFFHRVLMSAVAAFPSELTSARLPADPRAFRERYGDCLVRFEAARIASPKRIAIARHLKDAMLDSMRLAEGSTVAPLREALAKPQAAPALESRSCSGKARMRAEVP